VAIAAIAALEAVLAVRTPPHAGDAYRIGLKVVKVVA
jgi:hypothetical protein